MKHRFTKEEFAPLVAKSESMGHLLDTLGIIKAGGNYATMKFRIHEWGLDTRHWELSKRKRQGWQGGKLGWREIPLNQILIKNSTYKGGTDRLKKRLLREKIFEHKCYDCGITTWKNCPAPIELEHKNGDRFDNRIENLTLLCPNCHTFTTTYRGKNKRFRENIPPA